MKNIIGSVLLSIGLVGCGGGGGGSDELPNTRAEGSAEGKAQHGPIQNATISAYDWSGSQGEFFASTTSDGEGRYSLSLGVASTDMLIASSGGTYPEESDGRSVSMGVDDSLKAVIHYEEGKPVSVQLTYFTTLAACRAEYLVGTGINAGTAITQANNEFSGIMGESITGIEPVDTTKPEAFINHMTPAHRYGIAVAAVSLAVDKIRRDDGALPGNDVYTVKYFTNLGCSDILADGVLDGIAEATPGNPSGQLYLGSTAINTETYRQLLGKSVIEFGTHENNRTGLIVEDVINIANHIATSASPLFGGVEGDPVDNEAPTIAVITTPGKLLSGEEEIVFDIQDPLGVASIDLYLDGDLYASAQVNDQVMRINTTLFADGDHEISVIATDVLGNVSPAIGEAETFTYRFINTGAAMAFDSPTLVKTTDYTATGSFEDNGAGIDKILVNGVTATLDTDNSTFEVEIELSGNTTNVVQGVIFDSLGNTTDVEWSVDVDLNVPSINDLGTVARFTNFDGKLNACEIGTLYAATSLGHPVCLNAELVSLDGKAVSGSLTNDGYVILSAEIGDSGNVRTDTSDLVVEYSYVVGTDTIVDWSPVTRVIPDLKNVYLPITTEFLGSEFYKSDFDTVHQIFIRVIDAANNQSVQRFDVRLDVLTPTIEVSAEVKKESLFSTQYASRQELNLETYTVEYTYDNESSLPYVISLDPQNKHVVTQETEGSIRKNRMRQVPTRYWYVSGANVGIIDIYGLNGRHESLYKWNGNSNSLVFPEQPDMPEFSNISVDVIDALPKGDFNYAIEGCGSSDGFTWKGSVSHNVGGNIHYDTANYYGNYSVTNSSTLHQFGCQRYAVHGQWAIWGQVSQATEYEVEYEAGFPRNDVTDYSVDYNVAATEVTVINKTLGIEIFPINGWYKIPPNTKVSIVAETGLPLIQNKLDTRVGADDNTVPYDAEIFQDTALIWSFDTDLEISRAIDPGDISLIDSTSKTVTVEGLGVKTYTILR